MADRLPAEVWGEVFRFLPFPSIGSATRVCKRWHNICSSEVFFMHLLSAALRIATEPNDSQLPDPIKPLNLRNDAVKWSPPEPGSMEQILMCCVRNPQGLVPEVLAFAWQFFYPHPLPLFLFHSYATALTSEDRWQVISLAYCIGKHNPVDLFRGYYSVMYMLLSLGSRQIPEVQELLMIASGIRQRLELEQTSVPTTLQGDASTAATEAFVSLIVGKTPTKMIAEQLTARSWRGYSLISVAHFTLRKRKVRVIHAMTADVGTMKEEKLRRVVLDRLAHLLSDLTALRNYHMAMGLYQTLCNRWFGGRRVTPALGKGYRKLIKAGAAIYAPNNNYRAYRQLLQDHSLPCIPSLTQPFVDIRFIIQDTSSGASHDPNGNRLYNWKRLCGVSAIIRAALVHQQRPYRITADPSLQRLLDAAFAITHLTNAKLDVLYDTLLFP